LFLTFAGNYFYIHIFLIWPTAHSGFFVVTRKISIYFAFYRDADQKTIDMKLLFVVNPISGGVDKEPFLKDAKAFCDKYGIRYHIFRTTGKAEILFEEPRLLQLDGEVIGKFQEIRVEIIKGAVLFITHGDNKYIR